MPISRSCLMELNKQIPDLQVVIRAGSRGRHCWSQREKDKLEEVKRATVCVRKAAVIELAKPRVANTHAQYVGHSGLSGAV